MSQYIKKTTETRQSSNFKNGSTKFMSNQMALQQKFKSMVSKERSQKFDIDSEQAADLKWEIVQNSIVYNGGSDLKNLSDSKNILLDLLQQFSKNQRVVIEGKQKDEFNKRLILLENEIEGLMRRKILYDIPDHQGGTRSLDYTQLLNQKQNQIVQLEKKIQNLQERLRRASGREMQLQNEIIFLNEKLKGKNQIIQTKERALTNEVAFSKEMASIIDSLKRSSSGNSQLQRTIFRDLAIPSLQILDIKSQAQRSSQSRGARTEVIKLFRELEKVQSRDDSIKQVQGIIEGWILGLSNQSLLKRKLIQGQKRRTEDRKYQEMQEKFSLASQIYRTQLQKVKRQNPGLNFSIDQEIFSVLKSSNSQAIKVGDVIQIQKSVVKTVEVPVQDARTKHLIHMLASNLKRIYTKYPKLYDQIDSRLSQFFSQELIDVLQVDEMDKIIQVVKYVPQVVKVENVYAYSSQKTRKVQFHLRVLIKALLQQMQKIKLKSGIVPQIDEGVIGMIRQQIMGVVDVDDILKVYRVVPKIVEVQKVVQKVVQRIVQVPKIVQIQRYRQTPVEVKKYEVVENTINVPVQVPRLQTLIVQKLIEVPKIVQRIVQVPKYVDKIVQVIKQIPKVVQIEKIVQKMVQVQKIVQVVKQIIVQKVQYRDVQLIRQMIVPTERIVQKSIPVDRIIQKIIEVKVEVPKVVQVQKIVQKIVQRVQYIPAPQIQNHIEIRYQPVDRIIQKIVPILQIQQKIVQVPQIVQKIVQVYNTIKEVVQVQAIRQKPFYKDRIKQIQIIKQVPVVQYRTIENIIQKIVQVPIIQEVIRVQKQYIQKPMVQILEKIIYKQVEIQKPKIIYQDRILQVEKIINHIVKEHQPMYITQEKIVPVQKVIQRIKSVPTIIQKYIEKIVQVPKVVQVQKIVEKVVVVPRVIQKIVQIPQIVEKIVQKVVMSQIIKEVEVRVQVPVIQERVVEIEVPRNIYIQVQKPVDVVREVLRTNQTFKQSVRTENIFHDRVVVQTKEVPRMLEVQKIVTNIVQQPKIVQLNRDIIVPIQIEVPVDKIVEKIVVVDNVHREIQQVHKQVQKIVQVKVQVPKLYEVQKLVQKIITQQRVKQVEKVTPYIQNKIVQVQKIRQKVVPIEKVVQEIRQVKQIVQKVVDRVAEIPKVYEIEKLVEKRIDVPRVVQVQKLVTQVVKVNQYIERLVEKIVQIPVLIQQLKEIERIQQKIVQVGVTETQIKQVDRAIQKQVVIQRLKQVTNNVHLIEQTLKVVDKIIEKNLDPVLISQQKIIEVPHVIQKIVQRIVVMPQIVQVLKYITEITEKQSLGIAVGEKIGQEQIKYKALGNNLKINLQGLLLELRKIKTNQPNMRIQIQLIQKFLAQFETFILYPRIQQIIKNQQVQKIVEKDRIVRVPVQSEANLRQELSKTILIEKLLNELRNIKRNYPDVRFNLDDDINLIFFSQMGGNSKLVSQDFNKKLKEFSSSVQTKFAQMGGWTKDHQLMLNSFLQQRFLMANVVRSANMEIQRAKAVSDKRLQTLRKYKNQRDILEQALRNMRQIMPGVLQFTQKQKSRNNSQQIVLFEQLQVILKDFDKIIAGQYLKGEPTRILDDVDRRNMSFVRQKQQEIIRLREIIQNMRTNNTHQKIQRNSVVIKQRDADHSACERRIRSLQQQLQRLRIIQREHSGCKTLNRENDDLRRKIVELQRTIDQLRIQITTSPKQSINTKNSITSPQYDKKSQVISRRSQNSQSQSQSYGANYLDYANIQDGHQYSVGTIGNMNIGSQQHIYKSGYQTTGYKMSNSQVSGNSNRIESRNYLATQSRSRGQIEGGTGSYKKVQMKTSSVSSSSNGGNMITGQLSGGNMITGQLSGGNMITGQLSGGNIGGTGGKRYEMYYEKKYDRQYQE